MDLDRSQLAYIKAGNERIPTGLQLDGMELDGSQPAILDKPKMDGIQLKLYGSQPSYSRQAGAEWNTTALY